MTRLTLFALVCLATLWAPTPAAAQVPPFFDRARGLFDPEISVVNTGVVSDVQATVSHDRKHVTLNMRASASELVALREFAFQSGSRPTGFVGDPPAPAVATARRAGDAGVADRQPVPSDVRGGGAPPSVLQREGMTLVGSVDAPPARSP